MYVRSQSNTLINNTTLWWALQTQTERPIFEPARIHHLGLKAQNFENPIFTFGCFSLVYNSCKLQRLLQRLLFMHWFNYTNTVFLFRHLPTEIVIFANQMKCFSNNNFFLVLGAGFADISPAFLISCEVQTRYSKTLKHSEQYIWDHLSGTKVRIWICSEYDVVFSFACISSCNLTKSSTFSFISFLSQESDSESFKQSTCTLPWLENLYFCFWNIAI